MNRQVLKAQAKDVLKNHYWPMVGLSVLLMILAAAAVRPIPSAVFSLMTTASP